MFIITGMVFDLFDGMVARKLDAVSEIGGELDSFADLVTLVWHRLFLPSKSR